MNANYLDDPARAVRAVRARTINLKKDHQKGNQIIALPLDSIEDALIPQRYIQRSKIQ